MKLTYAEQLRHPSWQRKRLDRLNASGWRCDCCEAIDLPLQVHHKRYVKGRMAWEYPNGELESLCEGCHATRHRLRELLDEVIANGSAELAEAALGLVAGYAHAISGLPPGLYRSVCEQEGVPWIFVVGCVSTLLADVDAEVADLASIVGSLGPRKSRSEQMKVLMDSIVARANELHSERLS